ncbi:hypothetical protein EG329_005984 [Mollisiaceae sp. DMI_Dod_QoI]|nr:hypothetical protein EG329_005984 [Helotiales sp. DMI_Dod_QoI]
MSINMNEYYDFLIWDHYCECHYDQNRERNIDQELEDPLDIQEDQCPTPRAAKVAKSRSKSAAKKKQESEESLKHFRQPDRDGHRDQKTQRQRQRRDARKSVN